MWVLLWVPGFLLKWEIVKPVVMKSPSRPFSPGTGSRNLLLRLMVFSIHQSIRQARGLQATQSAPVSTSSCHTLGVRSGSAGERRGLCVVAGSSPSEQGDAGGLGTRPGCVP